MYLTDFYLNIAEFIIRIYTKENALIYIPKLNTVFNNQPLSWNYWLILIAFVPSVLIVEELRKLIVGYVKNRSNVRVVNKEA